MEAGRWGLCWGKACFAHGLVKCIVVPKARLATVEAVSRSVPLCPPPLDPASLQPRVQGKTGCQTRVTERKRLGGARFWGSAFALKRRWPLGPLFVFAGPSGVRLLFPARRKPSPGALCRCHYLPRN